MKQEYWCVVCGDCDTPIPLLKSDTTKQIRHPEEFQATCPLCKAKAAYEGDELSRRKLEGIPAFLAGNGFYNVTETED
jgi:hypothetical protein